MAGIPHADEPRFLWRETWWSGNPYRVEPYNPYPGDFRSGSKKGVFLLAVQSYVRRIKNYDVETLWSKWGQPRIR